MNKTLSRWPDWLRWALLLPTAIFCGAAAGFFFEVINLAQAESPNAPIVYIAMFLGALASNWVALYVARIFAPSMKKIVVFVLGTVAVVGNLFTIPFILSAEEYGELFRIAGSLFGCYVFWREFIREPVYEKAIK